MLRTAIHKSDPTQCNRQASGSGWPARHGHDERDALFGWTEECIATQASDPVVALAARDAHVVTRTATGGRQRALTSLHLLPTDGVVDRETVLERGELIEAIEPDRPVPHSAYAKGCERESYEYALASAAATVPPEPPAGPRTARIAPGSVAMRRRRFVEAEHPGGESHRRPGARRKRIPLELCGRRVRRHPRGDRQRIGASRGGPVGLGRADRHVRAGRRRALAAAPRAGALSLAGIAELPITPDTLV